jgi:epoxyqueuosine reductase
MPERTMEAKDQKRRETLTAFVKAQAQALGFDLCRITRPDSIPDAKVRLGEFIDAERHGTMEWMAETRERRGDPRTLWSDVQSVVVFALNYAPDEDPRGILDKPDKARSPSMPAIATITTSSRDG